MREWFTAAEIGQAFRGWRPPQGEKVPPTTESGVIRRATSKAWRSRSRSAQGGGQEYHLSNLSALQQARLLKVFAPQPAPAAPASTDQSSEESSALWERFDRLPQSVKDEAARCLAALRQVLALQQAGGASRVAALRAVAAQTGVSQRSLQRWFEQVAQVPEADWLPVLAPRYKGRTATAEIPPDAWEVFKADYLRNEQPAASACYYRLERIAAARGWTLPSLRTFERRIERDIPPAVRTLAREGEDALKRAYPPQKRSRAHFLPLQAVNADGHKFDVFVRFLNGTVARVVLLGWQDLYSGKILSWRLDMAENRDLIRLSFGDLVDQYWAPDHIYFDNTRAFASKWLTGGMPNRFRFKVKEEDPEGVLTALGCTVHWVKPYSGQSKPIERAWRDLVEAIARHPRCAGAYTGSNPTAKPANYGAAAVPFEEFEALVAEEITYHNARTGRDTEVCGKRLSFDEAFMEALPRAIRRPLSAAQRRLLLLAAEGVTAHRDDASVTLHGNRYWCEALSRAGIKGRKVAVRFDPEDLTKSIHVYHLDGRFIASADRLETVGFDNAAAAKEHEAARRRMMKATKEQADQLVRMDAVQVAAMIPRTLPDGARYPTAPAPAPEATDVVRPHFGLARAVGSDLPGSEDIDQNQTATLLRAGMARLRPMVAGS
jgi:putative transposase